jgi:hypothetical protein
VVSVIACRFSCGCARLSTQSGVAGPARAYQSGRESSTLVVKRMHTTVRSPLDPGYCTFEDLHCSKGGSPLCLYCMWTLSIARENRLFDVGGRLQESQLPWGARRSGQVGQ